MDASECRSFGLTPRQIDAQRLTQSDFRLFHVSHLPTVPRTNMSDSHQHAEVRALPESRLWLAFGLTGTHGGGDHRRPGDRQPGADLRRHAHDDRRDRAAAGADRDPSRTQGRRFAAHLRLRALRDSGGGRERAGAAGRGVLHPLRSLSPPVRAAGHPVPGHDGGGYRWSDHQPGLDAAPRQREGRQPQRERRLPGSVGRHAGFGGCDRRRHHHLAHGLALGGLGACRGDRFHGLPTRVLLRECVNLLLEACRRA